MYDTFFKSIFQIDSLGVTINHLVHNVISIYNRHFLPFRRADLTASTLLQRIRGEGPQLHTLRLVSAATSTRE
jgi:hypothetical protein